MNATTPFFFGLVATTSWIFLVLVVNHARVGAETNDEHDKLHLLMISRLLSPKLEKLGARWLGSVHVAWMVKSCAWHVREPPHVG